MTANYSHFPKLNHGYFEQFQIYDIINMNSPLDEQQQAAFSVSLTARERMLQLVRCQLNRSNLGAGTERFLVIITINNDYKKKEI